MTGLRYNRQRWSRAATQGSGFSGNFAQLFTSFGVTVLEAHQGDQLITLNTTQVASWGDTSGNGKTQSAAGAAQPLFVAAGLNGKPTVRGDGVANQMSSALTLPAPGTTPTFIWAILNINGFSVVNFKPYAGQTNFAAFAPAGNLSTAMSFYDGTVIASGISPSLNTWYRWENYFANSVGDYLKIGSSVSPLGTSAGNLTEAAAFWMFGVNGGFFCKAEYAAIVVCSSKPSAAQLLQADAAATAWFGATVNV